jgi:hypothetical protein
VSFSSISSLGIKSHAFFIFALIPAGGSLVSLILLSKIPIGTPALGSADRKSLNLASLAPESIFN